MSSFGYGDLKKVYVKKNRFFKSVWIISILFLVVFTFLVLSIYLTLVIQKKEESTSINNQYEYFEINESMKKDEKFGKAPVLPESSFQNPNLISTNKYECTGTCFCEPNINSERRNSPKIVVNPLKYFIAAVSSVVAIKLAKEKFQLECEKKISDDCVFSSSRVVVEGLDCEKLANRVGKPIDLKKTEDSKKRLKDIRGFWCCGKCFSRLFKHPIPSKMAEEFGCEKLGQEGKLEVDCSGLETQGLCTQEARNKFRREYLRDFCRDQSKGEYSYFYKYEKDKNEGQKQTITYLCVSSHRRKRNPIKCRQIYPSFN